VVPPPMEKTTIEIVEMMNMRRALIA